MGNCTAVVQRRSITRMHSEYKFVQWRANFFLPPVLLFRSWRPCIQKLCWQDRSIQHRNQAFLYTSAQLAAPSPQKWPRGQIADLSRKHCVHNLCDYNFQHRCIEEDWTFSKSARRRLKNRTKLAFSSSVTFFVSVIAWSRCRVEQRLPSTLWRIIGQRLSYPLILIHLNDPPFNGLCQNWQG